MRRAGRLLVAAAVITAGTAGIARAAGISVSAPRLGAGTVTLSQCPPGSVSVTAGTFFGFIVISTTATLSSCPAAADGNTLYVSLDDTAASSDNGASCTLAGSPPQCTTSGWLFVTYNGQASYTVDIFATPAATGSTTVSGNHLTLTSQDLLLRTCVRTGSQLTAGTTC